jgi:isopropylmalate/homocitrate/citramalate synthase
MVEASWKTDNWWVSPLNYVEEVRGSMQLPSKIQIHDITLRDGEQQAGVLFRKEEKIKIAKLLDEAGVDRIEAGFPAVTKEDAEAIKAIAKEGLNAKVFCFTRCMKADVDLALKCDVEGVMMEIPSSEHLIENAYNWPLEKALKLPIEATRYAKDHGLYVAFFTIDGTRANIDWWFKIIDKVATEGHMDSLILVDTFGACNPEAVKYFVRRVKSRIKDKPIEVHLHNDFGLAVANTLAAVSAGAEVVHTTVNGIGERTGNADLAQTALALEALYGLKLNVNHAKLREVSKYVEEISGVKIPPQYGVTGDNIYTVESGIVVGWWMGISKRNMPLIIFPYHWKLLGHEGVKIVLGKKSGRPSIEYKAKELNLQIPPEKIDEILVDVKESSIRLKRLLTDDEFKEIVKRHVQ